VARDGSSSNSRLLMIGMAVLVIGVILVLLIVRGGVGDNAPVAPAASPSPTAGGEAEQPAPAETPMTGEQISTARLPLPLDIPEGHEAVAVRANFMRGVAAIPIPGDRVNLYRLPAPDDRAAPATEVPAEPGAPSSQLPAPGPDSELALSDVAVLAVTGPLPAANDGTLTFVLSLQPTDVPSVMALANADELWFTLLPAPDEPTEDATEGDA
jgi:Flp pilus assembly protein CpaB